MKGLPLYLVTLTAAFVALDVTGKITWSWWEVTLPMLAAIAVAFIAALMVAVGNKD